VSGEVESRFVVTDESVVVLVESDFFCHLLFADFAVLDNVKMKISED
jgi:hypothetical protein